MFQRQPQAPFSVVLVPHSDTTALLIQNIRQWPLRWKFIGETVNEGETLPELIVRAAREEGQILFPGKKEYEVREFLPPQQFGAHTKFIYEIVMPESVLRSHAERQFIADHDEEFHTRSVAIDELMDLEDFLPEHLYLRQKLFYGRVLP
jgi:hypothetical protein